MDEAAIKVVSRSPLLAISCPVCKSSPTNRVFDPGFSELKKEILPFRKLMSSCNTTVSAPDGRTAPVNIRNASPDPISPENGCPAADLPSFKSRTFFSEASVGSQRKAYPSTAEFENGGEFEIATKSPAKTLPIA